MKEYMNTVTSSVLFSDTLEVSVNFYIIMLSISVWQHRIIVYVIYQLYEYCGIESYCL